MKAEEARRLTLESLNGGIVKELLEIAYKRIEEFAKAGKLSVPHPFYGASEYPSDAAIEIAIQQLRNDGYSAKYYDASGSDDPREYSYWEISW